MLTIFANIRIENEESLHHLKDSFFSFCNISDDWLINIRGKLRKEAMLFLERQLGEKMRQFELTDDSRGWIMNALDMLLHAKHEYVLVWNEDHLNCAPQEVYAKIIQEMKEQNVDYLLYSWWQFDKARKAFDELQLLTSGDHVDVAHITPAKWKSILKAGHPYYLISLCGIFNKRFFEKLLRKDKKKLPFFFTKQLYRLMTLFQYGVGKFNQTHYFHKIDRLFFHIFRRFPKETPFDLEKAPDRTDILPLVMAFPKRELFACIDDDLDTPGYQLIKRGEYPLSFSLDTDKMNEGNTEVIESNESYEIKRVSLLNGEIYRCAYYEDAIRTAYTVREMIIIMKGKVRVAEGEKENVLSMHDAVSVYPNIGYTITALENVCLLVISPNQKGKTMYYNGPQGVQKRNT